MPKITRHMPYSAPQNNRPNKYTPVRSKALKWHFSVKTDANRQTDINSCAKELTQTKPYVIVVYVSSSTAQLLPITLIMHELYWLSATSKTS